MAVQDPPGHPRLVDPVGPVVEAGPALMAIEPGQYGVVADPERAVDLNRTVDDLLHDPSDVEFDERDRLARLPDATRVDRPGRLQDQEPGGLDRGPALG